MRTHTHTHAGSGGPGSAWLEEDVTELSPAGADSCWMCPCHSESPSRHTLKASLQSPGWLHGRRARAGARGPGTGGVLQDKTSRAHASSPRRRRAGVQGFLPAVDIRGLWSGPPVSTCCLHRSTDHAPVRSELPREVGCCQDRVASTPRGRAKSWCGPWAPTLAPAHPAGQPPRAPLNVCLFLRAVGDVIVRLLACSEN